MNLQPSNSHALAAGKHFKLFFFVDCPAYKRAGDDRAEAFHGEDTINGKARQGG